MQPYRTHENQRQSAFSQVLKATVTHRIISSPGVRNYTTVSSRVDTPALEASLVSGVAAAASAAAARRAGQEAMSGQHLLS